MLGILVAVDDALLEVIPGADPERAVEGHAFTSLDFYDGLALAGARDAGAWLHDGRSWRQVFEGDVSAVRVAPDRRLFVGTEPAGLHISSDRGTSWETIDGVGHVVKHHQFPTPRGHRAPHVAGFCFPRDGYLVGIGGGGAWHTHDGGRSWLRRGEGLDPAVHELREHPEERDRLFASAASGFYRSEDAGFSWLQSMGGLDRSWAGAFAIVPGAPDRIVLCVARHPGGQDGAIFRSANGGVTWARQMLGDEDEWDEIPVVTRVWDSEDTLFVAAGERLWASHDGGRQWMPLVDGLPTPRAIAAAL